MPDSKRMELPITLSLRFVTLALWVVSVGLLLMRCGETWDGVHRRVEPNGQAEIHRLCGLDGSGESPVRAAIGWIYQHQLNN